MHTCMHVHAHIQAHTVSTDTYKHILSRQTHCLEGVARAEAVAHMYAHAQVCIGVHARANAHALAYAHAHAHVHVDTAHIVFLSHRLTSWQVIGLVSMLTRTRWCCGSMSRSVGGQRVVRRRWWVRRRQRTSRALRETAPGDTPPCDAPPTRDESVEAQSLRWCTKPVRFSRWWHHGFHACGWCLPAWCMVAREVPRARGLGPLSCLERVLLYAISRKCEMKN